MNAPLSAACTGGEASITFPSTAATCFAGSSKELRLFHFWRLIFLYFIADARPSSLCLRNVAANAFLNDLQVAQGWIAGEESKDPGTGRQFLGYHLTT